MSTLHQLTQMGQSIWYDNIRRALIDSGETQELIDIGVVGVTSNPSIFEKAIAGSADYDADIQALSKTGLAPENIYEQLAVEDIRRTADLFLPVYEQTQGVDGFVSIEVSPKLAKDADGTVKEARRLFAALDRPNVMIKIPATIEGVAVIRSLIGEGINVNVTLMFGLSHYEAVAEAYLSGLETLLAAGGDLAKVASVASFFVSRVDTAVDGELDRLGESSLKGRIAIANAAAAYVRFRELSAGDRWKRLSAAGARPQRLLWASTGTKNPEYPDTYYVEQLIGGDTVNTVPPATLQAFVDHGTVALTLEAAVESAGGQLAQLAELGIDLEAVTRQLQQNGLDAFAAAFDALLKSIEEKQTRLASGRDSIRLRLGAMGESVDAALADIRDRQVIKRIWHHDHTVWRPDPKEITNRLGWLHTPETMGAHLNRIQGFVDGIREEGIGSVLLLGMGGSSLAPEMFARVFANAHPDASKSLPLAVLDSTDPDRVLELERRFDLNQTLFIVATKSGGTVETLSAFKYFYNRLLGDHDPVSAGRRFIAITDPGSSLADLARQHHFREVFLNDPNIGGRYSALSYFGLVPAALSGVDLPLLLSRAMEAACNAQSCNCPAKGDNTGAVLGAVMGEAFKSGRDKITFLVSPEVESFGDWVEQLIAESTGKAGKGLLPVVGEVPGPPEVYGDDRLFVHLRLDGDTTLDDAVGRLAAAGHPLVTVALRDSYDLGRQLFLWEIATAVAGSQMDIHPFDQPNVEAAKELARSMVSAYLEKGRLPEVESAVLSPEALNAFMDSAGPGEYAAIHAYLQPRPDMDKALGSLRHYLRNRYRMATTVGYGPRFLHSTGQLHKGDGGSGRFIQLTTEPAEDVWIPDQAGASDARISFGVLKSAQAAGDAEALKQAGRRVIRFHLGGDAVARLNRLMEALP